MKSERRHELQHNVLERNLTHLLEISKKYINHIAWGALLVAVVVLVVVLVQRSRTSKMVELQNRFDSAMSDVQMPPDARLNELASLASQDRDEWIAAQANLALANEYASRLVTGTGKLPEKDLKDYADKSAAGYRAVIDKYPQFKVQLAQAHLGLGKLAESTGDFETASKEFGLAVQASPAENPIGRLASDALQELPFVKQPVPMATTAPATQPVAPQPVASSLPTSAPATASAPAKAAPATAPK